MIFMPSELTDNLSLKLIEYSMTISIPLTKVIGEQIEPLFQLGRFLELLIYG